MPIKYRLTPELRIKLKHPLGMLIKGSYSETIKRLNEIVNKESPCEIIAVGDTVSRNLAKNHVLAKLSITDNKCMRRNVPPAPLDAKKTLYVKNPQGTITEEAIKTVQEALKDRERVKIQVEGEEDLLTLIAIMEAPNNSIVVYGQPYEGIVAVKVTQEKKTETFEILKAMKNGSKN